MRLLLLTALAPVTVASIGQRRSLRPERASNDHDAVPSISVDDAIDDGFLDDDMPPKEIDNRDNDDGASDEDGAHKGPLKLFNRVDFAVESHFKGWVDLQLMSDKRSNDVELQFATADDSIETIGGSNGEQDGELTQNSIGMFPNNRFCGYSFDNAVDTHCHTPTSCQFQRCPSGMTCYVLSDGVMSWCDEEFSNGMEDNESTTDETDGKDELQQNDAGLSSSEPTEGWSEMPVEKPSVAPSMSPMAPSDNPTSPPSAKPSNEPSDSPTTAPTRVPITASPTSGQPSKSPSKTPTLKPTLAPSEQPSQRPSPSSTTEPSYTPTWSPTITPSIDPTLAPVTTQPSNMPSSNPAPDLSEMPTEVPTLVPTISPSTVYPSKSPSFFPTNGPADIPTEAPSNHPTASPVTFDPSSSPTKSPSLNPTTASPSAHPTTELPTKEPTNDPITEPSSSPITMPTFVSAQFNPQSETMIPTLKPSKKPSNKPSPAPAASPTLNPTLSPEASPPSYAPSASPTITLTETPTKSPSTPPFTSPLSDVLSDTVSSTFAPTTLAPMTSVTTSVSITQTPFIGTTPKPTESQNTEAPSQTAPSSNVITLSPSATLHPNDKFWKSPAPTTSVTPAPTFLLNTPEPTVNSIESAQPSKTKKTIDMTFPKIDYVLLTTQGYLSDQALESVESAVQTYLSSELSTYYEDSFSDISINTVGDKAVIRDVELKKKRSPENLIRQHRRLVEVTGTKIIFEGNIKFDENAPTESDLTDALITISTDSNEHLVSNITSTGNFELQDVVVVLVESSSMETSTPSSAPSVWIEDLMRTPDAISDGDGTSPPSEEARTSIIIVSICGVAALTMLMFVFATRSRVPLDELAAEDNAPPTKSACPSHRMPPSEIDVESVEASFAKSSHESHNETESGYYLNDNEASTIISSVTDWNDYATVDSRRVAAKTLVGVVNGSRSHEDVVATWFENDGKRKTAAELNNIGTRTLEKNDDSIVPKDWSLPTSGQQVPSQLSLGATQRGEESDSDESSINDGYFPNINGSFPTARQTHVDSRKFQTYGTNCGAEAIYNDLESSVDDSARSSRSAMGDWSHIGTVDDALPQHCRSSCNSHASKGSASVASIPNISAAPSQDTKDTSTSLNRFISDLVWLEKKITDENDAAKVREAVELTLKDSIQSADSYSYQCDSFSPRSNSSLEEDATTISSKQASQPISIVCRDCYVPPGEFKIDIVSTVDGPMINSVDEELNGHLGKGDLIIAVDDSDTRAMSAEEVLAVITSRSSLERKITVLQFGGITSMC